jgi:hypothetical protein
MNLRFRATAPFCFFGLLGIALMLDLATSVRCDDCTYDMASAPNQPCTTADTCATWNNQPNICAGFGQENVNILQTSVCINSDGAYTHCGVGVQVDCYTKWSCRYIFTPPTCVKSVEVGLQQGFSRVTQDCP